MSAPAVSIAVVQSDASWLVLEGSIDGCPQATQRRTIAAAALAAGSLTIGAEKAALIASVEQAYANWQAVQQAVSEL